MVDEMTEKQADLLINSIQAIGLILLAHMFVTAAGCPHSL